MIGALRTAKLRACTPAANRLAAVRAAMLALAPAFWARPARAAGDAAEPGPISTADQLMAAHGRLVDSGRQRSVVALNGCVPTAGATVRVRVWEPVPFVS